MTLLIYSLLTISLMVASVLYHQGRTGARPVIIATTSAILLVSTWNIVAKDSWYKQANDLQQKRQKTQGQVIGRRLASEFPASKIVIIHPFSLPVADKNHDPYRTLTNELIKEFQKEECTVEERTLPTPHHILQLLEQGNEIEKDTEASPELMVEMENARIHQFSDFIQEAKDLHNQADLIISLVDLSPENQAYGIPRPSECPKLVLLNCRIEHPETFFQNTAVIGGVRFPPPAPTPKNYSASKPPVPERFEYFTVK
ncbi:hypothetical protein P3T73_14445 [Kiritimatiellota bacterium B12222]|nr:hypothetical protein P3T73_14445 [Kiritimatiellota bacterium B12222]